MNPIHVVEMGNETAPAVKEGGLELRRFLPDGNLEWLLRFTSSMISIHCLNYSRWLSVWPNIDQFMGRMFAAIEDVPVIVAAGLKCIDQFKFAGHPEDYSARNLFSDKSKLLHARAFSSGVRWHCHTGWFVSDDDFGEILSQLNVNIGESVSEPLGIALSGPPAVVREIIVSIDHTLTCRSVSGFAHALVDPTGNATRGAFSGRLHDINKGVLADLLTDAMAKQIQLNAQRDV